MPVDEDMVRAGLPNKGGTRVTVPQITSFIASWSKRVGRRAGTEFLEDDEALEIIRLGATGLALQIYDADISRDSPGSLMIRQAREWLMELDVDTSGEGEAGAINADLVSQTVPDPLWDAEDFNLGGPQGVRGGTWWLP